MAVFQIINFDIIKGQGCQARGEDLIVNSTLGHSEERMQNNGNLQGRQLL